MHQPPPKSRPRPIEPDTSGRRRTKAFEHELSGQISVYTMEEARDREIYIKSILADLDPRTALEHAIAVAIAEGYWRLTRIRAVEDNTLSLGHYMEAAEFDVDNHMIHAGFTQARAYRDSDTMLERLSKHEARIDRLIEKQTARLEQLQAKRPANLPAYTPPAALIPAAEPVIDFEEAAAEPATVEQQQPAPIPAQAATTSLTLIAPTKPRRANTG